MTKARLIIDTSELKDELHKAFCFLTDLNPEVTKHKTPCEWKNCIEASETASLIWKRWYAEYGISFHEAIISANIPEPAYKQGVYSLHEANESKDYEYVLDITADTIEFLYEKSNVKRKAEAIEV